MKNLGSICRNGSHANHMESNWNIQNQGIKHGLWFNPNINPKSILEGVGSVSPEWWGHIAPEWWGQYAPEYTVVAGNNG